ncbi:MAG: lipoyl(octanoyl) transferase LipB [Bacteroidia bacterium]
MELLDIGLCPYAEAVEIQKTIHDEVSSGQRSSTLILCEHPHVYTLGKSADKNNLLVNQVFLDSIKAEVHQTDRGGDITYHGPGQLVGYPIVQLADYNLGVRSYVELLEKALIDSLASFNITAYQIPSLVGIWLGQENEVKRKIGAIGIKVSRGVSMHGFALNVNTDLSYFSHIVPCGITDKSVTSIQKELGSDLMLDFKKAFTHLFTEALIQKQVANL